MRERPRILVTDYVADDLEIEREVLAQLGADIVVADDTSEPSLVALAEGVSGILVCFAKVTEAVIAAAASRGDCRVISRSGIGYDNVDVPAATRAGVVVTRVPDYCLDEVADHTMALLLAHARGIAGAWAAVRGGQWSTDRGGPEVHRIAGRRLALLGLGGIGRRVAPRAQAFGLDVIGYDPYADASDLQEIGRADSPADAVSEAHFVSVHAPLTDETHHLVDAELISAMRRAPLVINTARGGLVDLDAVVAALESGALGGIACDVTEPEPLPADHPLRRHPGTIVTPHIAFHSVEATAELRRRASMEIVRALTGEPPENAVNPEVLGAS